MSECLLIDQKNDLLTQIEVLNQYCDTHHLKNNKMISDLGITKLFEEYGKKMFIHIKILKVWFKNNTSSFTNEEII